MKHKFIGILPLAAFFLFATAGAYCEEDMDETADIPDIEQEVSWHLFKKAQPSETEVQKSEAPAKPFFAQAEILKSDSNLIGAYNSTARFEVSGAWDFFIAGSFIYWQPREKGLDMATAIATVPGAPISQIVNMKFKYEPGFKVGLGTNFDHDGWGLFVQYTRLYMKEGNDSYNPAGTVFTINWFDPIIISNTDQGHYVKGRWHLSTNIVDLEIGRPCYIGTALTFKPFIGAKAAWLKQQYNVTAHLTEALTIYDSRNHFNSWLLGPRAGLNTNWLIGCGFRSFANLAGTLFYQHFKTTAKQQHGSTRDVYERFKYSQVAPAYEIAIGLGWGTYFDHDYWHFELSAAYEFQNYVNQNMLRCLNDKIARTIDGAAGDLMYHGLTATIRLDF